MQEQNKQLFKNLSLNLSVESKGVLINKIDKVKSENIDLSFLLEEDENYGRKEGTHGCVSQISILRIALIGFVLIVFILLVTFFISRYSFSSYNESSIGNSKILIFLVVTLLTVGLWYLVVKTYRRFEKKFESITVKEKSDVVKASDEIYSIITDTYEALSEFRIERERQAKSSYNVAISLIIAGVLIVFFGVFLLFKKNITEGALTSGIGAITNILGGTILNFYNNTNDRMDKLNNDLFVLDTVKVQYAMILKISDVSKRDSEISNLINSIGNIKGSIAKGKD